MNKELIKRIIDFRNERDWDRYHTGDNLAKSISIEAAELLEVFQWGEDANIDKVKEELADVLIYSILMAERYNLDIEDIIEKKLIRNAEKYPASKSRGNAKKYNEF